MEKNFLNLCWYCWGGGFFPYSLLHCCVLPQGAGNTVLQHTILSVTKPISGCQPQKSVQYSKIESTKEEPIHFFYWLQVTVGVLGCFEGGNYFGPGNTRTHGMNFLQKSILLAGRNISKLWRGGICKPSAQTEILKMSQEVEFINHQYRQKYWKIIKTWRL